MNCAYLSIGSNRDKAVNMKRAEAMLRAYFATIRFSPLMETQAIGCPDAERYLNPVAVCRCEAPLSEVQAALKRMAVPPTRHLAGCRSTSTCSNGMTRC